MCLINNFNNMFDRILSKLHWMFSLIPIAALIALATQMAFIEIMDYDIWLHLAMGKYISLHKIVPVVDMLSCTISGAPWINHEWLFQIIVSNIFKIWGTDGILYMQMCVVFSTMVILSLIGYHKEKQWVSVLSLILVFLVYQQRFTTRPDIFSLLFFALYIFILALHIDKRWSVYVITFIQFLWVNMHGFFFFGPLFIFLGLFAEFTKRKIPLPYNWNEVGCLTDDEYGRLKWMFLFACLINFANPAGIEGALYPIIIFFSLTGDHNKIFFEHIQELEKPITKDTVSSLTHFIYYKLSIFLSFVSFVLNRRNIDFSALLLWIVFLIFSISAVRNIAFFAFAAYLVIISNCLMISFESVVPLKFIHKRYYDITMILISMFLLSWMLQYAKEASIAGRYDLNTYEYKSDFGGVTLTNFPIKAVDFLVENKVKGNFFNDFNSGAYILGHCYPNIKVFIDGRTEVYGGEFFKQYRKILYKNCKLFSNIEKEFNLTGAFLNSIDDNIPADMLNYLYKREDWILVYLDYDGAIFLKDVDQNKCIINKFNIDLSLWKEKQIDFFRLGSENIVPYQSYSRAYSLAALGYDDAAMKELEIALNANPSYASAYNLKGKILADQKKYEESFHSFRKAASFSTSKEVHINFLKSYMKLDEYSVLIKQCHKELEFRPNDPAIFFLMAKAYAKEKDNEKAYNALIRGIQIDPHVSKDLIEIGDIVYDNSDFLMAERIYALATKSKRNLEEVYEKIGKSCRAQNKKQKAIQAFEKALSFNKENDNILKLLKQLKKE